VYTERLVVEVRDPVMVDTLLHTSLHRDTSRHAPAIRAVRTGIHVRMNTTTRGTSVFLIARSPIRGHAPPPIRVPGFVPA
jgi:hypothetical protein